MILKCFINGKAVTDDISPDMALLEFVRSQGCYSVKRGCETANCGLCTVWVDGTPVLSCSTPAMRVEGKRVTTLEGLQKEAEALGTAKIELGLKDKRIGVIGENRYEWQEAYLSITCGTGIVVPLDKALTENELLSLIERSEIEAIFYTSKYTEVMDRARKENVGKIKYYISMDLEEKNDNIYSQKENTTKESIYSSSYNICYWIYSRSSCWNNFK